MKWNKHWQLDGWRLYETNPIVPSLDSVTLAPTGRGYSTYGERKQIELPPLVIELIKQAYQNGKSAQLKEVRDSIYDFKTLMGFGW